MPAAQITPSSKGEKANGQRSSQGTSEAVRRPEHGVTQRKLLIRVKTRNVKGETWNVATFESTDEESGHIEASSILQKHLGPGDDPPQKHGNGQEPFRAHVSADHVKGEFGDDESDGE